MNGPAHQVVAFLVSLPRRALLGLLWVYQRVVSPWRPPTCRFYPSCSRYAVVAVTRHGAVHGSWLAVRRLLRCHPWAVGGVDDVPDVVSPGSGRTSPPSPVPVTSYEIRSSAR